MTNTELLNAEFAYILSVIRNAIFNKARGNKPAMLDGKPICAHYSALRKETFKKLDAMGIKYDRCSGRTKFFLPNKGTKAYNALFEGSDVLNLVKSAKPKAKAVKAAAKVKEKKAAAKVEVVASPKQQRDAKGRFVSNKKSAAKKKAKNATTKTA